MKYILSNETVKFEVANVKEDRNKYFEGGSIIPMQSNSVCSNKIKGEVASASSETSARKFLTKITSPKLKQVKKIST